MTDTLAEISDELSKTKTLLSALQDKVNGLSNKLEELRTGTDPISSNKIISISEASGYKKELNSHDELVNRLIGPNSIFVEHLHSSVINNGLGLIQPTVYLFNQYEEDISSISLNIISNWPIGFYRNKNTKEIQFLLNTETYTVFIDNLPDPNNVILYMKPFGDNSKPYNVFQSADAQLNLIIAEINSILIEANHKLFSMSY